MLIETLVDLDLVQHVAPVQLGLRLLIPAGSRLLELGEVREIVGEFDERALVYPWIHPDPEVDALQQAVSASVEVAARADRDRHATFAEVLGLAARAAGRKPGPSLEPEGARISRAAVPFLTEPWYC